MNMLDRNQYELANDSEPNPRESSTASSFVSSSVQGNESNRINLHNNNNIKTQEVDNVKQRNENAKKTDIGKKKRMKQLLLLKTNTPKSVLRITNYKN